MLFDLSGKRRSVIKVIYALLALLMGGSLVLFGIGSDAPGGILDAVGLGTNSSGPTTPQYEQQIEDAERRLEADPQDRRALLDLVHYRYLSATSGGGIESDPQTLATEIDENARDQLEGALDAWDAYLKTDPPRVDPNAAGEVATIQITLHRAALTSGDAAEALATAEAAAEAQQYAARGDAGPADYGALAQYAWTAGMKEVGDRAAKRAIELTEPSQRNQIRRTLKRTESQLEDFSRQLRKLAKQGGGEAGGAIQNPFEGLGGGSAGATRTP